MQSGIVIIIHAVKYDCIQGGADGAWAADHRCACCDTTVRLWLRNHTADPLDPRSLYGGEKIGNLPSLPTYSANPRVHNLQALADTCGA
jgi:hypothetical protein